MENLVNNTKIKLADKFLSDKEIQSFINKMSNWQRNQWSKSGRPRSRDELIKYSTLTR